MLEVLPIIAPLFVLLGVGLFAGFSRKFQQAQPGINAFVFYFALPAYLFMAIAEAPMADGVPLEFVLITLGVTTAIAFASGLIARLLRRRSSSHIELGPFGLASTYGNVGYLGVPLTISVLGPDAALAAALGQMLHNILFMAGYPLLKSLSGIDRGSLSVHTLGSLMWSVLKRSLLLNPVVLSAVLGAIAANLPISIPDTIASSSTVLGQAAVPAAMFSVGLAMKPAFDGMRAGSVSIPAVLVASAIKLIALPLATLLAFQLLAPNLAPLWVACAVIMAGMPVSSTANILSFEHDGEVELVGAVTLLTSLTSVLTLPLIIMWVM